MSILKPLNKKLATKFAGIEVDDLIEEILLRLPLQSIQELRTICKDWNSIVTKPTFRKQWRKRNLRPSTGLILRKRMPARFCFLPFSPSSNKPTFPKLKIKQSSNGLLLCSNSTGSRYHVINPTTNMSFTLPKLVTEASMRIRSMSLAFDPIKSPHYKVVCCVAKPHDNNLHFHVYSSDTCNWKSVSKTFNGYVNDRGVYWNGAIHWGCGLLYFQIENEIFENMPKLQDCGDWRVRSYFGESCDRFNYAKTFEGASMDSCSIRVYELKRDYSEWVLKCRVDLNYLYYATYVISVIHGAEEGDSFFVLTAGEEIVRYNLVSKISEELPFELKDVSIEREIQYIESQCDV